VIVKGRQHARTEQATTDPNHMTELYFSKRKQTGRDRCVDPKIPTPREERRKLIQECDKLWSQIIRARDNSCQWCSSKKDGQAHHIISKPRLQRLGNQPGRHDPDNGVRLCKACHLYRLKDYPDEYDKWVRSWLGQKGMSIERLLQKYGTRAKSDYRLVKIWLQQELDKA
jgi:hypothetical protein